MDQNSVQPNLASVQCWGIYHFIQDIIPMDDCSYCEKFSFCVQSESPQEKLVPHTPIFFSVILCKQEVSIFFVAIL